MHAATSPQRTPCPLDAALELLGRAWMLRTIRELLNGPRHFVELHAATGCPSSSTFTRRLRRLEQEGIVAREVLSATPPSVSYALTAKGQGLGRALGELAHWAEEWLDPEAREHEGVGPASAPTVLEIA
jgi:DNA-binding HxlR family transcriptional regulator